MLTGKRLFLKSHNVHICCIDFGGNGSPVLLLHGLAGRANEWHSTAQWLTHYRHVFALDQRGHGRSEKGLDDYSRDAYVNDVIAVRHLAAHFLGQKIADCPTPATSHKMD